MKNITKNQYADYKNSAKSALRSMQIECRSLKYACKMTNDLSKTTKEGKSWRRTYGVTNEDITPENVNIGWGLYALAEDKKGLCVKRTPIYAINPDGSFKLQEVKNDAGEVIELRKQIEFYVYDIKSTWNLNDTMKSIGNVIKGKIEAAYYELETPYLIENGKPTKSDNPEFIRRATNEARRAEEEARALLADAKKNA